MWKSKKTKKKELQDTETTNVTLDGGYEINVGDKRIYTKDAKLSEVYAALKKSVALGIIGSEVMEAINRPNEFNGWSVNKEWKVK